MRLITLTALTLTAITLAACTPQDNAVEHTPHNVQGEPVTLFHGGSIHTGNPDMPLASLVIVNANGRIDGIVAGDPDGDTKMFLETAPAGSEIIDLKGAHMYPGFVDGHAHLVGIGQRELTFNLEGTASIAALVSRVKAQLSGTPAGEALVGRGWIETGWPEGRMPTAADLDAVSPNNPVVLVRADGHALVANTAAIKDRGITNETPDPDGGKIERSANGAATGIFIDNAMGAFAAYQRPTEAGTIEAYTVGAQEYASRGWTGVHNMSVSPSHAPLLERLDLEGRMPLRLHNAYDREGFDIASKRLHETDTIQNRAVKVYMDGALGSRGALLIEPYSDRPGTRGLSLLDTGKLSILMDQAARSDVQLAIHAIGDLANRQILDAYEDGGHKSLERWRIEHTQIVHPDDIARIGDLGLIASMQPSHAIGDLKFAPARLGMNRLDGAYAWQDILGSGAIIVGGSDAPVEVGTPQIEFYAAVARKDLKGFSADGWHPEQALTRQQALDAFTKAPAYASFQEDDLGTIDVGKLADFTVFDRDILTIPHADILNAEITLTVVNGEIVHAAKP